MFFSITESLLRKTKTHVPCIGKQILYHWTTREVPGKDLAFDSYGCMHSFTHAFIHPADVY